MSPITKRELRIVVAFAIAGMMLPLALYPLWWLAMRDHPIVKLDLFLGIEHMLFPGATNILTGWNGPWKWRVIVTMWIEALAKNAAIYILVGTIAILIVRLAKRWFGHDHIFSK